MSKWIDFSLDEQKAMIQGVVEARQIDEAAAETCHPPDDRDDKCSGINGEGTEEDA